MKKNRYVFRIILGSLIASLTCGMSLADVVFPANSGIADVTAYGANGNDNEDDTQAFRDAISAQPNHGTVYVPNGTYYTMEANSWLNPQQIATRRVVDRETIRGYN